MHGSVVIVEVAAVEKVVEPLHIEVALAHVVPQAPGQFCVTMNELSVFIGVLAGVLTYFLAPFLFRKEPTERVVYSRGYAPARWMWEIELMEKEEE